MLVKLAFANVRKSARDFAVYFFTLVLGVAVFYAFNSIADSSAVQSLPTDVSEVVQLLSNIIAGVSVFIAIVLGFLVLYANAFLIRRRRAEFGMYLTLGMGKGDLLKISACETLIVGTASLVVGLLAGVALSQALTCLCLSMMAQPVEGVTLSFSAKAFTMTVATFAAIFAVSMFWNSAHLAKSKLIDLLAGSRKNDKPRLRNLPLSFALFIVSLCIIGYSYSMLLRTGLLGDDMSNLPIETILVSAGTVLLFFSLSGFLLKAAQMAKPLYLRGLNMFFLRQLASRINSTFVSMSVIAMTLFLALTSVCGGIGIIDAMQKNVENGIRCDASFTSYYAMNTYDENENVSTQSLINGLVEESNFDAAVGLSKLTEQYGAPSWDSMVENSAQINFYPSDVSFDTLHDLTGLNLLDSVGAGLITPDTTKQKASLIKVSDFNAARELCGLEQVTVNDGECLLWSDFATSQPYLESVAAQQPAISIGDVQLKAQREIATDTIECTGVGTRAFQIVVPDDAVTGEPAFAVFDAKISDGMQEVFADFCQALSDRNDMQESSWPLFMYQTAEGVQAESHNLTALASYLAMYIGFIMVVACAAILAIQQLSDANDNARRYELLAKLGAPQRMISGALFKQVLVCFAFPLVVAIAHTICAMQTVKGIVLVFGNFNLSATALMTAAIFLAVYGAYFLVTYFSARAIVMPKRS
ncbi:FtsX-like permease family protein [Slackia isoflavoniconvertens]|uniref:FtsX-like permease family protein n=1 Tax=Slackia isoflavoniconvertens TaxID=572010 RepID=UPI003AEF9032